MTGHHDHVQKHVLRGLDYHNEVLHTPAPESSTQTSYYNGVKKVKPVGSNITPYINRRKGPKWVQAPCDTHHQQNRNK